MESRVTWNRIVAASESHIAAEAELEAIVPEYDQARQTFTERLEHLRECEVALCSANEVQGDERDAIVSKAMEGMSSAYADYEAADLIFRKKASRRKSLTDQVKKLTAGLIAILREAHGENAQLPFGAGEDNPEAWKEVRLVDLMGPAFSAPFERLGMDTVGGVLLKFERGDLKGWVKAGELSKDLHRYLLGTVATHLDRRAIEHPLPKVKKRPGLPEVTEKDLAVPQAASGAPTSDEPDEAADAGEAASDDRDGVAGRIGPATPHEAPAALRSVPDLTVEETMARATQHRVDSILLLSDGDTERDRNLLIVGGFIAGTGDLPIEEGTGDTWLFTTWWSAIDDGELALEGCPDEDAQLNRLEAFELLTPSRLLAYLAAWRPDTQFGRAIPAALAVEAILHIDGEAAKRPAFGEILAYLERMTENLGTPSAVAAINAIHPEMLEVIRQVGTFRLFSKVIGSDGAVDRKARTDRAVKEARSEARTAKKTKKKPGRKKKTAAAK